MQVAAALRADIVEATSIADASTVACAAAKGDFDDEHDGLVRRLIDGHESEESADWSRVKHLKSVWRGLSDAAAFAARRLREARRVSVRVWMPLPRAYSA